METANISILGMMVVYSLLIVPLFIFWHFKVPLIKMLIIASVRMGVQLVLIGVYLRYIFDMNSLALNLLWLSVMLVVANRHILKSSGLKTAPLILYSFLSTFAGLTIVLLPFIAFIVKPEPLYDARYLIPLGGMILGNFLSVNIVSFSTFVTSIKENRRELESYLCMGATLKEAAAPFIQRAMERAITPTVTTIATLGLVSLPGMMTGQLLGGSVPMTAIKYQIAIMVAIFVAATVSVSLNLLLTLNKFFDNRGNFKEDLLLN